MSGIVGVIQNPSRSVAPALVRDLTDALAFRGPDSQEIWCQGHVGFGCALLRTTPEAEREQQPFTLDGATWLVADVRLDARAELLRQLAAAGRPVPSNAPDAELILQAYAVWGEDCVLHLLGDFAFAIWDGAQSKLFAVRDHFGVKPFYYAAVDEAFVFSNTVNCLRRHPEVPERLNDAAIGDFLLFGYNVNPATTTFAAIARLPAAHGLTLCDGQLRVRRYWSPSLDGCIRYRRDEEYVEHFRTLYSTAVADRLRTDRAAIFMSGGGDSTAVAAAAVECLARNRQKCDFHAHTVVFDRLIRDPERHYAGVAADYLRLPIHYLSADDYTPFDTEQRPDLCPPEPNEDPTPAVSADQFRRVAQHSRMVLSGDGGDPLFYSSPAYMMGLLKSLRWDRWLWEVARFTMTRRRLPPLGLRFWVKQLLGWGPQPPAFPEWIEPDFAKRCDLRSRWHDLYTDSELPPTLHAEAYKHLTASVWSSLFESMDPGCTTYPVEVRYPLFDVRLVEFVLAIPVLPWCADKELVRRMMCGMLPEEIRRRPKTPLQGDPLGAHLRQGTLRWTDRFDPIGALAAYVNVESTRRLLSTADTVGAGWEMLLPRPLALNRWLRQQNLVCQRVPHQELLHDPRKGNARQVALS